MKKITSIAIGLIALLSLLLLTGCTKHKAFTFDVETGDKIKVEMKTNDGYNLTSRVPIDFSKDDKMISKGSFAIEAAYDTYYNSLKSQSDTVKILEEDSNKNIEYFFYEFNDDEKEQIEYNYIIRIKNSHTCFVLTNTISKESAKEVFERLTFSIVD